MTSLRPNAKTTARMLAVITGLVVTIPGTQVGARTNSSSMLSQERGCSIEALPGDERRRMQEDYVRRIQSDGQESADAWVREQARRFHQSLVDEGACAAPAPVTQAAEPAQPGRRGERRCTRTRMEVRNIANPGGGAMSMIMVPVCIN